MCIVGSVWQLVECAVRALGYFFEKSIEIDKNSKYVYRGSSSLQCHVPGKLFLSARP
jgi:hypothetical protein